MQLVLLTDIHGSLDFLPTLNPVLAEADGVIVAGDITTFGNMGAAQRVIAGLTAMNPHLLAVSGNCDIAGVDDFLLAQGMGLHATCIHQHGLDFVGVSGSLPCPGSTPNELGESRFVALLQTALTQRPHEESPLVLVSHQPAYGTHLDMTGGGGHAGSTALRDFIEREQPILAVSGHIHESAGIDRVGNCTLVNPGPFKTGHFARACIENGQVEVQLDRA